MCVPNFVPTGRGEGSFLAKKTVFTGAPKGTTPIKTVPKRRETESTIVRRSLLYTSLAMMLKSLKPLVYGRRRRPTLSVWNR